MRMTLTAPNRRDRNFTSSKMSPLKVTRKATTLLTLPDVWRRKESQTFSLIPCCSRRRTNFGSNRRFAVPGPTRLVKFFEDSLAFCPLDPSGNMQEESERASRRSSIQCGTAGFSAVQPGWLWVSRVYWH
jgi:hypothetical protein